MKLVVGLGNPGTKYTRTRHNVGWRLFDEGLKQLHTSDGSPFSFDTKSQAMVARVNSVLYCKPETFMNNSGQAMRALVDYYSIDLQDVIVVYDDKDLPFGTVRLRSTGSAGGHNGLQSIIDHLGTADFTRVRIGVAPEHPIGDTAKYVLGRFSAAEEKVLPDILALSAQLLEKALQEPHGVGLHQDLHVSIDVSEPV